MAQRGFSLATVLLIAAVAAAVPVAATSTTAPATRASSPLLLREVGMIMAHDAGTSYLPEGPFIDHWAKTQPSGGFGALLDCGARALDVRSELHGGRIIMHHGAIPVPTTLETGIDDVMRWSKANPDELVYLYMSHDKNHIDANITDILKRAGVAILSCGESQSIAFEDALKRGPVIATLGCMQENYDPAVLCEEVEGPCWRAEYLKSRFARLVKYFNATLQQAGHFNRDNENVNTASLWMLQAHWQYDAAAIALGTLEGSTVIKDNTKSGMNDFVAKFLRALPAVHKLNIVELDNVCVAGAEIRTLLGARDMRTSNSEPSVHSKHSLRLPVESISAIV
ncbi:Hypothetical Protein FCC1311_008381 [Hondaea fermentalgiana]|uniref:Uncharacterized protein n=1 Tax=Hondaea fermentalgiana TaxID=2315210 RepID=A0A2R5H313_9STRA|nr:Hypothetical Protein FCC1311_008381 [Hondaea fermentalgiana]|eukprot:GBG34794.1 Hypothetical Protein FCC1311_008381 [Hondaea fermentalgiana]